MNILAHRGFWTEQHEKNSMAAFKRAFDAGFGVETDIRDKDGELVISHDIPLNSVTTLHEFLEIYKQYGNQPYLALNIKADGLCRLLKEYLDSSRVENYFVFDMSIPDELEYIKSGLKVFTRQSEFEPLPVFYESSKGVWIDCFESDWIDYAKIMEHLSNKKQVCIVSPELHGRPAFPVWSAFCKAPIKQNNEVFICTDSPESARRFFK
ncbi:MAG: glycerophosphodiester phosphodiesterase family protein [Clostridia bacterium]|nr:glycerophosphodiester phosphodiesterase family protein [Clostridia bacterium]